MYKTLVLVGTLSIAGVGGLSAAQETGGQAPTQAPAAALSQQDTEFFQEVAQAGLLGVKLGQLAVKQGVSDQVKKFGQRMIDDHSKVNARLAQLAHEQKGLSMPAELDKKHQHELDKMAQLAGAKFDDEYMSKMVDERQSAVKAFEKEAKDGSDAELKQVAATNLPMLREQLSLAKQIHDQVKGK
jgi:putative membrane protein